MLRGWHSFIVRQGIRLKAMGRNFALSCRHYIRSSSMALTIASQIRGNVVVFRCRGRIVFGDEGAVFRERVRSELTGTSKIVIDVSSVDYVDSGGLGILVGLYIAAKNRGGDIKLVSPSQRVQRVLGETKLNGVFSMYKTVDEALAAFSRQVA